MKRDARRAAMQSKDLDKAASRTLFSLYYAKLNDLPFNLGSSEKAIRERMAEKNYIIFNPENENEYRLTDYGQSVAAMALA